MQVTGPRRHARSIAATHAELGERWLYVDGDAPLLFTENETNTERALRDAEREPVRQGRHQRLSSSTGRQDAVNPGETGTKAAAHHRVKVAARPDGRAPPAAFATRRPTRCGDPFADFDDVVDARIREADEFYRAITPPTASEDAARVMRQALAGMLWSKQYYFFDVDKWLEEHGVDPFADVGPRPCGIATGFT